MKNIVFVFVMVLMLGSCKDATKNLMPSVTGKINQVLVIAEKNMWDGAVGDTGILWTRSGWITSG